MSITSTGGTLHGVWTTDQTVTTSDRRLKRSIVPLYRALAESAPAPSPPASGLLRGGQVAAPISAPNFGQQRDDIVSWVLRELRPVSFSFKSGPEAKHSRYGFVAQELKQVLPALVRGSGEEHLSVIYQDLIALLAMAAQSLQAKVLLLERRSTEQADALAALTKYVKELEQKMGLADVPASSSTTRRARDEEKEE